MKLCRPIKRNVITQKFGENKSRLPYCFTCKLFYPRQTICPVHGTPIKVASTYETMGMKGHNGWDWWAKNGDPIYWNVMDCEGLVIDTHIDRNGGLGVKIVTEDKNGLFKHLFWHLKEFACVPGQTLNTGDLIGYADNTGRSSGPHLHYSIKRVERDKNGNYVNTEGDNGFYGGIDPQQFFEKDVCAREYMDKLLRIKKGLAEKVVSLLKKLLKFYKGR